VLMKLVCQVSQNSNFYYFQGNFVKLSLREMSLYNIIKLSFYKLAKYGHFKYIQISQARLRLFTKYIIRFKCEENYQDNGNKLRWNVVSV
jgi:hypothetical protein